MMMTGSSFALHPVALATAGTVASTAQPAPATQPTATTSHHFSFGDFLDIINPLQHLPIIGTAYRAITHDKIDTPEKIIGDTLYGGVVGLASSVADTLFEKATGHNFGDTILALFTGHHDSKTTGVAAADSTTAQVATAAPVTASPAQTTQTATSSTKPAIPTASTEETALSVSLSKSGADSDLAQRALFAYRRANGLMPQTALAPF